jgi:hypothetical protein
MKTLVNIDEITINGVKYKDITLSQKSYRRSQRDPAEGWAIVISAEGVNIESGNIEQIDIYNTE